MTLRQERLNRFLVQEISEIVRRMKDPRFGFITFTEARVSPDFRVAQIGVSVYADESERGISLDALQKASGYIRRVLIKNANMKSVPMLEFHLDEGALYSAKVQELLNRIQHEQAKPTDA